MLIAVDYMVLILIISIRNIYTEIVCETGLYMQGHVQFIPKRSEVAMI